MPARKANSIGREGVVVLQGGPDEIAAGVVVPTIDPDKVCVLASALGLTSAERQVILEGIANRYYRDKAQEAAGGATKGERNASIAIMLKLIEKAKNDRSGRTHAEMRAIIDYADDDLAWDMRWEWALRYGATPDKPVSRWPRKKLKSVLEACQSSSRGPVAPLAAEVYLIAAVILLYEASTGRTATHNPKVKTDYTGQAESEAGRFVTTAAQVIDPALTATKIANLMEAWLKKRRDEAANASKASQVAA